MKRQEYACEYTFNDTYVHVICWIMALIFGLFIWSLSPIAAIVITLIFGGMCSSVFWLCKLINNSEVKKHNIMMETCDYKTQGRIIKTIESRASDPDRGTSDIFRTFVVEYIDKNNECKNFTTPTLSSDMEDYFNQKDIICDVYVKGNDALAKNFRKE